MTFAKHNCFSFSLVILDDFGMIPFDLESTLDYYFYFASGSVRFRIIDNNILSHQAQKQENDIKLIVRFGDILFFSLSSSKFNFNHNHKSTWSGGVTAN